MTDLSRLVRHAAAMAALCALLGGCASSGTVVLLPEKDGGPSALTVKRGDKEAVLDQPYAAAKTTPLGPSAYQSNPMEVEALFAPVLAALPARASSFTLYFAQGKDEFTEESKQVVDQMLSDIARRPVPDVLVIGHTDSVGSDRANDALGRQRAETVREALIQRGIAPDNIHAISRGKRAPAVPTPDGVAEPRNSRVEIIVR